MGDATRNKLDPTGKRADQIAFRRAAQVAMEKSKGFEHNGYKIEMSRRGIIRALEVALAGG